MEGQQIFLDEEESHHCIKVMRHHAGDVVEVTDGQGKKYTASVVIENRRECVLEIIEPVQSVPGNKIHLHLAIAPTRNIDRFEWLLEKITEIGIDEITPLICHRSERSQVKHERLNKLLIAAMKQSLRSWLPRLNEPVKFSQFISAVPVDLNQSEFAGIICHCQHKGLPLLKTIYQAKKNTLILIGPEGDFTPQEIDAAVSKGFTAASLGTARLRTETAGLVAIHTVQLLNS